jgi:Fur family zinc uptake transcriptional regulator
MATAALLDKAERLCARRGAKLTELRRQVLALILDNPAPSGAYDLLERLRTSRGPAAPPTVYRALDFLLDQKLIHRVERLAAFVACIEDHDHGAQFLICTKCGQVTEMEDHAVAHALADAVARAGFTFARATIEAEGLCAACVKA